MNRASRLIGWSPTSETKTKFADDAFTAPRATAADSSALCGEGLAHNNEEERDILAVLTPRPKLLLIADDLTGALDAGAQCANERVASYVATEPACDCRELFQRFDVVALNSETRHCAPERAAEVVREAAKRGLVAGAKYLYKKTDSTLRGNIGAELDVLRQTAGKGRLVFVPASPKLGRTTVNGVQFVWGQPLHETAYARDPRSPTSESFIPAIIAKQTQVRTVVLTRDQWQNASEGLFQNEGIYVCDAETDSDLQMLAFQLTELGLLGAIAAPAVLAGYLPTLLGFHPTAEAAGLLTGRMLVVVGSVNQVSLQQAASAEAEFNSVWLPAAILRGDESVESELVSRICDQMARAKRTLLQTTRSSADVLPLRDADEYDRVCRNVARIVNRVLAQTSVDVLAVFGGDTLLAIARERGWRGLLPRGEIIPGIMQAEPVGDPCLKHVLSKPGGFGGEDALLKIAESVLQVP